MVKLDNRMSVMESRVSQMLSGHGQRLDQVQSHQETTDEFLLHLHTIASAKPSLPQHPFPPPSKQLPVRGDPLAQRPSPPIRPQQSLSSPSERTPARVDPHADTVRELKAWVAEKSTTMGGSLCQDWCRGIPPEVILCVVDIYVGDGHDPSNQPVTDLVYMHRANHKLALTAMTGFQSLQRAADLSRQQTQEHLNSMVVRWAAYELKSFQSEYNAGNSPPRPRMPCDLEATTFYLGVKKYYQSYDDLVTALARFYREYEETPAAWKMVKEIVRKLHADRETYARRGGTTAASTVQRAEELVGMFDVTYNFTLQRLDKNGCLKISDPPMWLREYLRDADIAQRNATQRAPPPTPAPSATPSQNTSSKMSFKRCFDIFRRTFIGMSGFPHAKQQFKGTNKLHDI